MNFMLLWLLRDLRHHARWIVLWAVAVALFTWARNWLRTHPGFLLGDRDLWLSIPAAGLGIAEVCLILAVLLDDPARGAQAFWKTRPPAGASVFFAKFVILALIALAIPLAGEGVFLAAVGPSAGTPERFSLYLVPAIVAIFPALLTSQWKGVFVWLPVTLLFYGVAAALLFWLLVSRDFAAIADHRLIAGTALTGALAAGFAAYRRRSGGWCISLIFLAVSAGLAAGVACSGWPRDARYYSAPPQLDADRLEIRWAANRKPEFWKHSAGPRQKSGVTMWTEIEGIPDTLEGTAVLLHAVIQSGSGTRLYGGNDSSRWTLVREGKKCVVRLSVDLNDQDTAALRSGPFSATGTLQLRFDTRTSHHLPMSGSHTIAGDGCRWTITPAVEGSARRRSYPGDSESTGLWSLYDFINEKPLGVQGRPFLELRSLSRKRPSGEIVLPLENNRITGFFSVWEGEGRSQSRLDWLIPDETSRAAAQELQDPASRSQWILNCDTRTFAGVVEVPVELHSPPP